MINKNKLSNVVCLVLVMLSCIATAQVTLTPEVVGTSGGTGSFPTGSVDYTVGECIVTTISSSAGLPFTIKDLTQGFHQPNAASSSLNDNVIIVNSTCIGANNGSAMLQTLTSTGPVTFQWTSPVSSSNALIQNLAPGVYYFTITDTHFTINDSVVITEDQVDCGQQLNFYNGITPNGDGHNDDWQIDGITNFSESHVSIYNRWGDIVWTGDNYDNVTVVWKGLNFRGEPLPDATYFYLIEAGGKKYKGWVELTH